MKYDWKRFGATVAAWMFAALVVHALTDLLLGAPIDYLVPAILVAGAIHVAFFERTPLPRGVICKRGVGLLMATAAVALAIPRTPAAAIPWQPFSEELLEAAKRSGQPVMIDFRADGCPPCVQMERKVFSNPRVVREAADFLALKADLTDVTPKNIALAQRFQIDGFPTVVFIDTDGGERVNLRLYGYEPAPFFIQRLQAAK